MREENKAVKRCLSVPYHLIQQRQKTSNTEKREVRVLTLPSNMSAQQTTETTAIKRKCSECARASDCVCVWGCVCVTSV